MRLLRALPALALTLISSGCGYVHFGRLPDTPASDSALSVAYSNLSTENKMLKQELTLARKEGDTLRLAIDKGALPSSDLANRLNETTRELAALRASYAKLSESKSAPAPAAPSIQTAALEEKLAASQRNYAQLQEENAKLRTEVDRTRAENTTLTAQVKTVTAQNQQAQAALAQLNTELLAQKEARSRAEQQAASTAAQLSAVMAQAGKTPSLADARENAARPSTAMGVPAAPTAELRTDASRSAPTGATPAPGTAPIIHVVQSTDTLEKIAVKYYGDPSRWRTIYFANNSQLSGGRPLKAGMQLEIPQN